MQVNCSTYILFTLGLYQLQIKNVISQFKKKLCKNKGKAQKVQLPEWLNSWYQNMAKKFCDLILLGIKQHKHCYLIANELHLQKSSAIYSLLTLDNGETIRRPEFEDVWKSGVFAQLVTNYYCTQMLRFLFLFNTVNIICLNICAWSINVTQLSLRDLLSE